MPRLGLSISESFDSRSRPPRPDQFGRRIRSVDGVHIVGERDGTPIFSSLFVKATATLALVAAGAMSLAVWRLFSFVR